LTKINLNGLRSFDLLRRSALATAGAGSQAQPGQRFNALPATGTERTRRGTSTPTYRS
jgi:hypothetical protein